MFKKFLSVLILTIYSFLPAFAEKIPVKITPIQVISTHHDQLEVGDLIKFVTVNDVYTDDSLYIKKNTVVAGIVDFVHPNGWCGDSAEIVFKKFYTNDINNKKVCINSNLDLNGNSEMANSTGTIAGLNIGCYLSEIINIPHVFFVFRGPELRVEPDTKIYNIFIER